MLNSVRGTAHIVKDCPHYVARQNATQRSFATWKKLLGICHKIYRIHIRQYFFANYNSVYKNCGMRNMYSSYATPKITSTLQLTANIGTANL